MDPNIPTPQGENNTPQTGVQTPAPSVSPNLQPNPAVTSPQPVAPIVSEVNTTDQPPAPSTSPTPQVSPEPVKKSSPVFVIALILLLIAIVALGGYVLWTKYLNKSTKTTPTPVAVVTASPTSDPTAGWKTYDDQESRFTFKYPASWKQVENYVLSDITPTYPNYRTSGSDYYIVSTNFIDDMDFSSWVEESGMSSYTYVSGVLNGYQTHSSYDIPGQTLGYNVFIEYNNKMLKFSLFPYDRNYPDPKIIEIYNQILSTFKFIEVTPTVSPASSPSATVRP